jgi:LmbE family N-acetylglucosaminyl deacetylase
MSENQEDLSRVMLIGAHPDDPEFGCGATMAKWAAEGKEITYVILTNGDKGTHDPDMKLGDLVVTREEEQWAAARVLGVKEVIFLRYPDQTLENTISLRREVAGVIREHKPHILVAIDPWRAYQLHPDHRAAGFVSLDAIYAARELHVFPEQFRANIGPWRIKEAYLYWTANPDYWEDVTGYLDLCIQAIACHKSQVRQPEKLEERIHERKAETGKEPGYEFAEAFKRITF